jgi:Fur family ferric uptake transcriptional regulator
MGCEAETVRALKRAGHKVTPQRILILSALRHAGRHVTAAEILDEVRRQYPYVDASTVYRTLAAARELGLVSEAHLGGEAQFEWTRGDRHHHIICRGCGQVSRLDSSYLDGLATALLEDHGFAADIDHFAIFGLCRRCRRQSDS